VTRPPEVDEGAPANGAPIASERFEAALRLVLVGLIVLAGIVGATELVLTPASGGVLAPRTRLVPPARVEGGIPIDAARFAAGSCVSFAPTNGNRHLTVFLDAGHGGVDPGAVGTTRSGVTVYEKNLTLAVELDATKTLRTEGFRVVDSRTNSGPVAVSGAGDISEGVLTPQGAHNEVAARDVCANLAKADILIGIYFDAGSSPRDAGSITDYDAARPFSVDNLRLAKLLQRDVLTAMNARGWGIPNVGVNLDIYEGGPALTSAAAAYDHLLLLGPSKSGFFSTPSMMPGAIIEPLFATDPFEASLADSTKGQRVIAGGIAETVEQYFGSGGK
jgi:N-acetylmuramoyl-L-alanine amidase